MDVRRWGLALMQGAYMPRLTRHIVLSVGLRAEPHRSLRCRVGYPSLSFPKAPPAEGCVLTRQREMNPHPPRGIVHRIPESEH